MPRYLIDCAFDKDKRAYKIVEAENEQQAQTLLKEGKYTLNGSWGKFEKSRILLRTTYYDSQEYALMDYEEYVKMCRQNDEKPKPKGSRAYYDDIAWRTECELDDFKSNLKYSKYNKPCLMTGTLGLWNGHPKLCPVKYDSLLEGVEDIMRRADCADWEIILTEGHLQLLGKHHDDTNIYELHVLSAKGLRETERPKYTWEGHEYKPQPDWFRKIFGWL